MSYTISLKKNAMTEDCICLTEEFGALLLTAFCASGVRLAKTAEEQNLIAYCKKSGHLLRITEIPFCKAEFLEQKQFLLSVLEGITDKIGWEIFPQPPQEAVLFLLTAKLRCFFQKITWADVAEEQKKHLTHCLSL